MKFLEDHYESVSNNVCYQARIPVSNVVHDWEALVVAVLQCLNYVDDLCSLRQVVNRSRIIASNLWF